MDDEGFRLAHASPPRTVARIAAMAALGLVLAACTRGGGESPSTTKATTAPGTSTSTTTSAATTTSVIEPVALWDDMTDSAIGVTGAWSNKVDLADLDGDGDVEILFADGGDYDGPGTPVVSQIWINDGDAVFEDRSIDVLGDTGGFSRVIKGRDLNADGNIDIVIGNTWETQSRLLLGQGGLDFEEVTGTHLPKVEASVGDLEVGDVDNDGDLDMLLTDWGPGSPMSNAGAPPLLWVNDGTGIFDDVTTQQIPDVAVRFSWEIEFVDADNDYDLDIAVSCKQCSGSFFLRNDGSGHFEDATDQMPQFRNSYEFEVIDLNGDGLRDLLTINDGPNFTEHVFLGNDLGGFTDATEDLWPDEANIGGDDNMVVILDYESDGDPDFLIGSLDRGDRLMVNDGFGNLTLIADNVFSGAPTPGTLGIAIGDLNGDNKVDVVQSQGEGAEDDRVFLGVGIAADSAPPVVENVLDLDGWLHARVHDNKTPTVDHDWQRVYASGPGGEIDLEWYGEFLWRAQISTAGDYQVCAVDRAGNKACADPESMTGSS